MKNVHSILMVTFLVILAQVPIKAEDLYFPVVEKGGEKYWQYMVKKSEGLYRISKLFNVSQKDILDKNPQIIDGLKQGDTLLIPQNQTNISLEEIPLKELEEETMTYEKKKEKNKSSQKEKGILSSPKAIQVALLLPFGEDKQGNYIEFYEGLLLGLEKIKKENTSVSLYVYDVGKDVSKTSSLLKAPELKGVDMIIAHASQMQIQIISDFSFKESKALILPFEGKADWVRNNPYIFQLNPSEEFVMKEEIKELCKRNEFSQVLFLKTIKDEDNRDLFFTALTNELNKKNIPHQTISLYDGKEMSETLIPFLDEGKSYLLIPTSGGNFFLQKYVKQLSFFLEIYPDYSISLWGNSQWMKNITEYIDDLERLNTTIYTTFKTNVESAEVTRFRTKFLTTYSHSLKTIYPNYAMLGYDVILYFVHEKKKFNSQFIMKAGSTPADGLQTSFNFEQINKKEGYFNSKLFFTTYQNNKKKK